MVLTTFESVDKTTYGFTTQIKDFQSYLPMVMFVSQYIRTFLIQTPKEQRQVSVLERLYEVWSVTERCRYYGVRKDRFDSSDTGSLLRTVYLVHKIQSLPL